MDNDSLLQYLKGLHPAAFEGWDEYQVSVEAIHRKNVTQMMIVTLNNEDTNKDSLTGISLHRMFTINVGTEEVRVGRVGGSELRDEVTKILYPKVFKDEN